MPVPDELRGQGRTLLVLVDGDRVSAEIASAARRSGWEPMVAGDAVQFGYLYSEQQPKALVVNSLSLMDAVNRLKKDGENPEVLCILAVNEALTMEMRPGWQVVAWPAEQKVFSSLLEQFEQTGEYSSQ